MSVQDISASDAISDPLLFGPFFDGPSWAVWRSVNKAVFAEPMSAADLTAFKGVAGGREPPPRRVREFVAAIGRGGGKDSYASFLAAYLAMTFDPRGKLRPGERAYILCIAVDKEQAAIAHGYIRGLFEQIPAIATLATIGTSSIELTNGVTIQVIVNSHRAVRGRSILACILDEAAFFRDENSATPDTELYTAVEPGLARVPGSLLCVISSVHKRAGLLYQKIRDHFGKDDPSVLAVMGSTTDFNPSFDARTIEHALLENPEKAGAEYLSRWRDDLSSFIDRELVEGAVDRGVVARPPDSRTNYIASADVSGGRGDAFTIAVAHRDKDGMAVLDATMERRPPFNPSAVVSEAAVLLRNYACTSIVGDNYGQEWVVDAFAQVGVAYVKSERDRNEIYLNALPLFTSGRARLLDDRRLVSQFASLERRVLSSGREKVEPGADHDDLANASSIALTLAGADAEPVLIKYPHFLICGKPLPEAPRYYHRFLSMAVSQDGKCAVVWWACFRDVRPQLIMEDFSTGYFSEPRFAQYGGSLGLCYSRSSQHRVAAVVDPCLGWGVSETDVISDFSFLAVAAAYVASGTVKVTQNVHDKSRFAPINDALDFRYSKLQDALPAAVVAGVFRGLHE